MKKKHTTATTAENLEQRFDNGEDVLDYFDLSRARRPNREKQPHRLNLDVPNWMVQSLDREAGRIGVTRQSLLKMWIADKLASLPTEVKA